MILQDLVVLEKSFENVIFSEKDHSYLINGQKSSGSVTQLLKKYEKPFDAKKLASIVAAKQGVLPEDVLSLWNFKKEYACLKGTLFHLYVENFLQKKKVPVDKRAIHSFVKNYSSYVNEEEFYKDLAQYISNFLHFYEEWKESYILIRPELVIGDKSTGICGCIDNLSYNFKTNQLAIFDYKSNKDLKKEGKENLLNSLSHLQSTSIVKYSLQLQLYRLIFERNTPFNIDDMQIVWVGGNSLETIPVLDLKKEAQIIIDEIEN